MQKKYFQKLTLLLDQTDRRLVVRLFFAFLITSIIETIGVASVFPAMSMIANEGSAVSVYASSFLKGAGVVDPSNQKAVAICFFVAVVVVANILSLFILRASSRASNIIEKNISSRLFKSYLSRPYPYFLKNHTSNLHRNVLTEVSLIKTGIIVPLLNIFSKALTAFFIFVLLVYVSPIPTVGGIFILSALYFLITVIFQRGLDDIGKKRYHLSGKLNKLSLESLTGVREVKLFAAQRQITKDFETMATKLASYKTHAQFITGSPRYIIEALILTIAGVSLVYFIRQGESLVDYLPVMTLYVVAIYRMMPLFQSVYVGVSNLNFNYGALEKVVTEFQLDEGSFDNREEGVNLSKPLKGKEFTAIAFSDVRFSYEEDQDDVLKDISFSIDTGQIVGLFGLSGSGKTTILDMILGLIKPTSGEANVYSTHYKDNPMKAVGYVPQKLYLVDGSVAENIAFGQNLDDINMGQVKKACQLAQIDSLIEGLDDGYLTPIGENASRLSGGQRQRLAIARALYHDPDILILDEATNGLDHETENNILDHILTLTGKTIVLVSHHKSVMSFCDVIYKLSKGEIVSIMTKQEFKKNES